MGKVRLRSAVWSLAFELNSFYIVNAIMALMIAYYAAPEHGGFSTTQIMMIASVPGMTSLVGTLSTGALHRHVSQKSIAAGANVVFILQAIGIIIFHKNYYAVLLARGIFGIAQGMLMTVSGSLVATHHADEKERNYVMGMRATFQNAGGMLFSFLAGIVAAEFGWQNAFWLYLLCIIPIMLTMFFLPQDQRAEKTAEKKKGGNGRLKASPEAAILAVLAFLAMLACYTFNLNISSKVQQSLGLTAAESGAAIMLSSFGGVLAGIIFHKVSGLLKNMTLACGIAVEAFAIWIISSSASYEMVLLGSVLFGTGYATWVPAINIKVANCSGKETRVLNMSLVMAGLSLGIALSPWVMRWLCGFFYQGEGVPEQRLLVAVGLCGLTCVAAMGFHFLERRGYGK